MLPECLGCSGVEFLEIELGIQGFRSSTVDDINP